MRTLFQIVLHARALWHSYLWQVMDIICFLRSWKCQYERYSVKGSSLLFLNYVVPFLCYVLQFLLFCSGLGWGRGEAKISECANFDGHDFELDSIPYFVQVLVGELRNTFNLFKNQGHKILNAPFIILLSDYVHVIVLCIDKLMKLCLVSMICRL